MNNNRKSPTKQQQQRMKNSYSIPVPHSNRLRSNSSMGTSYSKNPNSHYRQYSHNTSPTAMSASSLPAVPLFYSNIYADPPDCSALPKPPDSWYLKPTDENIPIPITEEKEQPKPKPTRKANYKNNNNKGYYNPFHYSRTYEKFPAPYISVKA